MRRLADREFNRDGDCLGEKRAQAADDGVSSGARKGEFNFSGGVAGVGAKAFAERGGFLGPLLDAHYTVIKHEWLVGKFMPFYRTAVEMLKEVADGGGEEGADCDDFGIFLRQMTGLAGIVGHTAGPAAAQVVVFQSHAFSGVGNTRERHAVGLFLTERGWFVLEPQNGTELVATENYANKRGIQYITFH